MYTKKMNPRIFLSKHSCHDSFPSAAYDRLPTHTLPSLWVRSAFAPHVGVKGYPNWEETPLIFTRLLQCFFSINYFL